MLFSWFVFILVSSSVPVGHLSFNELDELKYEDELKFEDDPKYEDNNE